MGSQLPFKVFISSNEEYIKQVFVNYPEPSMFFLKPRNTTVSSFQPLFRMGPGQNGYRHTGLLHCGVAIVQRGLIKNLLLIL